MEDNANGTRTIEVEVDESTARELDELAWSYGTDRQELLKQCCEKAVERAHG